jgi:hypothetical protein
VPPINDNAWATVPLDGTIQRQTFDFAGGSTGDRLRAGSTPDPAQSAGSAVPRFALTRPLFGSTLLQAKVAQNEEYDLCGHHPANGVSIYTGPNGGTVRETVPLRPEQRGAAL